jgi:hypothetical protein
MIGLGVVATNAELDVIIDHLARAFRRDSRPRPCTHCAHSGKQIL